jgi:cation-transporting ATPase 13A3/4/5
MNESILTGESNPIIKSSIKQEETPNLQNNKHLLFFGSKIVQKNTFENEKCLGIVQNTGYKTVKGGLIRSILFPQDTSNKFEKDSTKYIIVMATLSVIGFFISSYYLFSIGIGLREIIFRSFDMITITVPPALPACISIGISKALSNLKKKNIKCIDREKINNAGRINHICFDKTGTLTEENLDISGFLPNIYINKNFEFGEIANSFENHMESIFYHFKNEKKNMAKTIELISLYIECFACCHSITKINQNLMGDMIDLKMFQMSGFFIDDSKENSVHKF